MLENKVIHLRSVTARNRKSNQFPFNVPAIQSLTQLDFAAGVTFLVGENGSGKSTLLEAIACSAGLNTIGSVSTETDHTLKEIRSLARSLKLAWSKKLIAVSTCDLKTSLVMSRR